MKLVNNFARHLIMWHQHNYKRLLYARINVFVYVFVRARVLVKYWQHCHAALRFQP